MPDVRTPFEAAPFDHTGFLENHFDTPDGVLGLMGKYFTYPPNRPAVVKWFTRGSIPADWLVRLLFVVQQESGERPDMNALIYPSGGKGEEANDIFS